jgi:hypothetical protein
MFRYLFAENNIYLTFHFIFSTSSHATANFPLQDDDLAQHNFVREGENSGKSFKNDGFSLACQFNAFCSILLTCRDFYQLANTVKIEDVAPYLYFQGVARADMPG